MNSRLTTWLSSPGLAALVLGAVGVATLAQFDPATLAGTVDLLDAHLQGVGTSPMGAEPSLQAGWRSVTIPSSSMTLTNGAESSLQGVGTSPHSPEHSLQGVGTSPS